MSLVTVVPRGDSDGSIKRQFVDSIDSTARDYTYETEQENLTIWNKGYVPIILNVGTFSNVTIQPLTTWQNDVTFSSFTIQTSSGISEIQVTAKEYDNKPVLNSQLASIANVKYNTVTSYIDVADIATQISNGVRTFYFPKDKTLYVSESILITSDDLKFIGRNTTIIVLTDIPIFITDYTNFVGSPQRYVKVEITGFILKKRPGTKYHIDIYGGYLYRIHRNEFYCKINTGDDTGLQTQKAGLKLLASSGESFVNYIENNHFSACAVEINTTDSYVRNNILWGYAREFALKIEATANIFISENQIIGSSVYGGIYTTNCNMLRIHANEFDGNNGGIDSGQGLNASNLTDSTICGNSFYFYSKEGIYLYNCNNDTISDNTFYENNKLHTGAADIYGRYAGAGNYGNSIRGNTFRNTAVNTNSFKAITEYKDAETIVCSILTGNIVLDGHTYNSDVIHGCVNSYNHINKISGAIN